MMMCSFLDIERTPTASIRVRVEDGVGEFVEIVFEIVLLQDLTLEISFPNAITPNGDNVNDTWVIDNIINHPDVEVIITNVQKDIVFSSVGYKVPFDGTFNGTSLPTGAYPFRIKLSTGETTGILHILRLN